MKHYLFTLVGLVFTSYGLSQEALEGMHSMTYGTYPAFYIDVPSDNVADVDRQWREYIGQYGRLKKVPKSDDRVIEETRIHDIGGARKLTIYSRTEKSGAGARQFIWIDAEGQFLSGENDPKSAQRAKELLIDFYQRVKVNAIADELAAEERALLELQKQMERLVRQQESLLATIEAAKLKITEAEAALEINETDQATRTAEMTQQQQVIQAVQQKLDAAKAERG